MTEFDALETELAAMRPRQPSDELKSRIAALLGSGMSRPMRPSPRSVGRRVAVIGGLVAASLAAMAIWLAKRPPLEADSPDELNGALVATAFDPNRPSVWTYRRAVIHSPDSLDDLFDRHATVTRESQHDSMHFHAFARLDSTSNDVLGEL